MSDHHSSSSSYQILRMSDGGRAFTDFRPKNQWQMEEVCGQMDSRGFREYMSGQGAAKELEDARSKAFNNIMILSPPVLTTEPPRWDTCTNQPISSMPITPPSYEHTSACTTSACHIDWKSDGTPNGSSELLGMCRKEAELFDSAALLALNASVDRRRNAYLVKTGKPIDPIFDAYGGLTAPPSGRDASH